MHRSIFLLLIVFLVVLSSACVQAGELFDDYLNYVRPGTGTGPGGAQLKSSISQPLGQTFTVPENTGEIYRIGVRPVYDTWQEDETVTMVLYDSPEKSKKLGEYAIGYATCHVDDYVVGNGSQFKHTGDRILYYQFRKLTEGKRQFYFELSVEGGDGEVAFFGFDNDSYAAGRAYPEGAKDVAFECHIKPVADKEANLRKFFTESLDISRPELAAVKAAVEAEDWEKAIAETVKHFHNRRDIWETESGGYRSLMQVKIDPSVDTSEADLILQGMVKHNDTKEPIPWRKESWWHAEIPGAKQPNHGIDPNPFLWHFDRSLGYAYTATGKEEYARKAIDLRMQFILDNPNPKRVYGIDDDFPFYFEIWNDRTAGARTPGHGDLVYARFYNYPGWTNDEKLIFFSFLEDNAYWVATSSSGGNWGAEAARAAFSFGTRFPEWKKSKEYAKFGSGELVEQARWSIRRDGTSPEAAIKYHAMVARRIMDLYEAVLDGNLVLSDEDKGHVVRTLTGMYEHMAYTLQPKNFVVMCGDSWYENYVEGSAFGWSCPANYKPHMKNWPNTMKDPKSLALKLKNGSDPVSRYLRSRFEPDALAELNAYDGKGVPSEKLQRTIFNQFNRVILMGYLYDPELFAGVQLRDRTRRMIELEPKGDDVEFLNKWLIEDAYPNEIAKGYIYGELYHAGKVLNRPDIVWVASMGEEGTPPKEISKVFPEGGYYIMRSDFGGSGKHYSDAHQLFVHNGGWIGGHGHWDFTCINLYGYGRTLIIDPGQYAYKPPPGIDVYWTSRIHSMLVMDGRDVKREPGPSEWITNPVMDWYDGRHYGYSNADGVDYIRRKIIYVKPDYYLVDDSAKTTRMANWSQVWNLTDPNAYFKQTTGEIETTFDEGGNLLILNQDPMEFDCEWVPGITATDEYRDTRIFRLNKKTDNPRFQTLLYPYEAGNRPNVKWERILPDEKFSDLVYSVRVNCGNKLDWAVFGESGTLTTYRNGKHRVNAGFALVRLGESGGIDSFSWARGREFVFNGRTLAAADSEVFGLAVKYSGSTVDVIVEQPHNSLSVLVGNAQKIVLNGEVVAEPVVKNGVYYPYAGRPDTIVADDKSAFERVTDTSEWAQVGDPAAWSSGFTHHETDPGRHENGNYIFNVPKTGRYRIDVYLPAITMVPSDRIDYRINASGNPVAAGGAITGVARDGGGYVISVNHQAKSGWVTLGTFNLNKGELKINASNQTEVDGIYFTADAMRLVESK